jgi:predicted HTH domain antitoxin
MEQVITIEYPAYLANSMRMSTDNFEKEIKTSALVKLFEMGKISSGTAAKVLQINRIEFLDLLVKYNIGFLAAIDLWEDMKNA